MNGRSSGLQRLSEWASKPPTVQVDPGAFAKAWMAEVDARKAWRDGWVPLESVARRLCMETADLGHWLFREGMHVLRIEMSGGTLGDARVRVLDETGREVLRTLAAIPLVVGIAFLLMLIGEMIR